MNVKKRFIQAACASLIPFIVIGTANAQNTTQNTLVDCRSISDSAERVACYDEAIDSQPPLPVLRIPRATRRAAAPSTVTEAINTAPTSTSSTPASPAIASGDPEDNFGIEHREAGRSGPDQRSYQVAAAKQSDLTGWTIEFENGQVWKQIGAQSYSINVGEVYTLQRASFNSYFLSNSRNNRKIRVSRTQ